MSTAGLYIMTLYMVLQIINVCCSIVQYSKVHVATHSATPYGIFLDQRLQRVHVGS